MTPLRHWRPITVAFIAAFAVGVLGALTTDIGPWYLGLKKPSWQPPDWLFGPAWTLIFALSAVAGAKAWRGAAGDKGGREWIVALFAANAFLNVLWSLLFFRLKHPDWALYEVPLLWLSVLVLMIFLRKYSVTASWLLVPYLVWVSFAAILNYEIVRLNAPF